MDSMDSRETLSHAVHSDGNENSLSSGELLKQLTIDNNPPSVAVYQLAQPTTACVGTLSTLTNSDHPTVQQITQHPPTEWSDTPTKPNGGAMLMKQCNRGNSVDMRLLFRTAQQAGFPRFTVVHSDGRRLDVAGTREGWAQSVPTLAREKLMRETYHALTRCRTRSETQPIALKMEQPATFSFATVWRVELVAIEQVDTENGKRLKWTFRTLDDNRTITALTKYSTEPDSKFARWVRTLTNEANPPIDTLDLQQLLGKTADAVIVHRHTPSGAEQLELFNLVQVKR
jgi:hypothetical protein